MTAYVVLRYWANADGSPSKTGQAGAIHASLDPNNARALAEYERDGAPEKMRIIVRPLDVEKAFALLATSPKRGVLFVKICADMGIDL